MQIDKMANGRSVGRFADQYDPAPVDPASGIPHASVGVSLLPEQVAGAPTLSAHLDSPRTGCDFVDGGHLRVRCVCGAR